MVLVIMILIGGATMTKYDLVNELNIIINDLKDLQEYK